MLTTTEPLLGLTTDDAKEKPALIKLYDFTKGGTDFVDQKMGFYSTKIKFLTKLLYPLTMKLQLYS